MRMPSKITKNGRVQWKARVQKNREIKTKLFSRRKEAQDWEAEQRNTDWSKKTDTEFSLGKWGQEYLDYASKFSAKTYFEKRKAFKEFFGAKDRDGRSIIDLGAPVSTLTAGQVLKALQIQNRNRTGHAANKDRKNLVAAWNWGIKYYNFPKDNPCLVDKFPAIQHERYIPPEQDFWKVYDHTYGQDRVMLATLLYLAARRGEIFQLKWTDLDFEGEKVRLCTRKRREGSLEYDWLPMVSELKRQLLWWRENRTFKDSQHVFVCEDDYNFCNEYYGKPFKGRRHFMKRCCEKVGVKPFGFHAIRHLTATILYKMGKPVSVIQNLLRHKHATTTNRYLGSLGLEDTRTHLEDLCHLRGPDKGAEEAETKNKQPANVIALKDHLEKRSQAV